jgi:hypothetical protein
LERFNPPCTYNKNRQASKQASKQTNKIEYPKTSTYQSLLLTYQEKFNPPHTHTHTQQQQPSKQTYKTQNEYLQIPSSSSSHLPRKIQSTLQTQPTTYKKPKKTPNEQNPKQVVTNPFYLPT